MKVEMFGIETTEILSAHEDHKKQGVTPHMELGQYTSITLDSC